MISLHIGGGGIRATFVSHCLQNLFTNSKDMIQSIDEVSGVSAGSIVATCVATDTSLNETIEFLNQQSFVKNKNACASAYTVYKMWNNERNSFYESDLLNNAMHTLFFSKTCKTKLNISVAQADSFKPQCLLIEKKGMINPDFITASCSIPGLFSPVKLGQKLFMDAGTVQELNNESILKCLNNNSIKLHILCSCHPWTSLNYSDQEPYNPDFFNLAKSLANMLWDTGVRTAHYNKLSKLLGVDSFPDGRSLLCMKRHNSGFKCKKVVTADNHNTFKNNDCDFYVLLFAPKVTEYVGFENATLIDPPSVRKPVIDNILSKCKLAKVELNQLVAATGLVKPFNQLVY